MNLGGASFSWIVIYSEKGDSGNREQRQGNANKI